jgi:hypothetical protein
VCAALPGNPEDLLPPFRPQCVQGEHVSIVRQFRAGRIQPEPPAPRYSITWPARPGQFHDE